MGFRDRVRTLFTSGKQAETALDDPSLTVVAASFDHAEAASAALARASAWRPTEPVVLRHYLTLPQDRLAEAAGLIAQDGYELRENTPEDGGFARVFALRAQVLDALRCAQERSRMASLAQRLGGEATGWDAMQTGERETDNIGAPAQVSREGRRA
ncbi:hypothetical protein SAMN05216174_102336 [Actinokineospora iranica]|uniref:Uncharacterized protein n=2 Tax=Actinokineospora iranica TaxID=1271860 RepID=A0A1G6M257_9PSEU|nr:hypothetical protein [Actinokineospora iranica]SDC49384.1 hypothetical protein SAMN05216174_102336 [Actinokineospora iranica]